MAAPLSLEFSKSYGDCEKYPQNLIYKASYKGVLKAYEERIETALPRFLTQALDDIEIHFRQWDATNSKFTDHQVTNEDQLRTHLGEVAHPNPATGKPTWSLIPRRDPACRFIHLYADNSTKPLKITPRMLKRLFSYHQVMPSIIDFLAVFAHPPQQRELGFSGFFNQTILSYRNQQSTQPAAAQPPNVPRGPRVAALGRSGLQYQLCYNLKRVVLKAGTLKDPYKDQDWSIQQCQFHHQFDVIEGTMLWVSAKGGLNDYRDKVLELTGGTAGIPEDIEMGDRVQRFQGSLTVHLMNCHWAVDEWRNYISYLETAIMKETRHTTSGPWINEEFKPRKLQTVQLYEEKASSAIMILEGNIDVMTELRTFYQRLLLNPGFNMATECIEANESFVQHINDMINIFATHKRRAKVLVDISENRKNLLLQKLQSLATKKMEDLTTMGYREAIFMKVIAAGTFVFLPATFVSTLFSTDIVKYQNTTNGSASYSWPALRIWLEFSVPLTVGTLIIGFLGFWLADQQRKKKMPPSAYDD
ncbi:hypothetical protein BDV96DRAFT_632988 [Lophiotrema nucula]|uniref:CorA-like transporter domain-containing protein n=1 Tax=Lophiotrema nucula TaxID=690887 RepID=A0A6A5Z513_9PLEO|nr:hypothetical protein BDV96DRAFT_632988 [Lophiotrema nucula]